MRSVKSMKRTLTKILFNIFTWIVQQYFGIYFRIWEILIIFKVQGRVWCDSVVENKVKILSYWSQTFNLKVLTKDNFFLSNGLPWIRLWTLILTFGGSKTAKANPIRDQNHIAIFCPTLHSSRQALDTNSNQFWHALSQNLTHFENSWSFHQTLKK